LSEISKTAKFDYLRYAQVWEDADVLLEALDIQEDGTYLSIASAGDNAFAMLSKNPKEVIALDLNPIQLYAVELRAIMYRHLSYDDFLKLYGARACVDRVSIYQKCCEYLSDDAKAYWDSIDISHGIASGGKFEKYFKLFRTKVLPLVHSQKRVNQLLEAKSQEEREIYYHKRWNSWRWRLMFRLFFSRKSMGKLGRDKAFFKYAEDKVAQNILSRTQYALTALDTSKNPYLYWILKGAFGDALPVALREENFDVIKQNLDALTWKCCSIERYLSEHEGEISGYNLSDIFEYMGEKEYHVLLNLLHSGAKKEAHLVYWNMMAVRKTPDDMHDKLRPMTHLSANLHAKDKAFFYQSFVIDKVVK
jgi:S-adenosylmethionine-diacylglycerol 3-amino-3-carboxypropyl transferase